MASQPYVDKRSGVWYCKAKRDPDAKWKPVRFGKYDAPFPLGRPQKKWPKRVEERWAEVKEREWRIPRAADWEVAGDAPGAIRPGLPGRLPPNAAAEPRRISGTVRGRALAVHRRARREEGPGDVEAVLPGVPEAPDRMRLRE